MWGLILSSLLWLAPIPTNSDHLILIADDCSMWSKYDLQKKEGHFGFSKDIPGYYSFSLTHAWLFPKDKLATLNMTFAQIMVSNHQYSSELTPKDWLELDSNGDKKKIYLLRPDDYCSEKRFVFNQEFVLYEVRIHLSGDE